MEGGLLYIRKVRKTYTPLIESIQDLNLSVMDF